MSNHTFHVQGMHCPSCARLIEGELGEQPGVARVAVSDTDHRVELQGAFGEKTPEEIARELTVVLQPHGYTLSVEKTAHDAQWADFRIALPMAGAFIALFMLLQRLGLVNLMATAKVGYGLAFGMGVIASLSTCIAVVGGLALSLGANFSKSGDRVRPQALFHVGRLASFFVLGGLVGAVGAAFPLFRGGDFGFGLIVGAVMIVLGLNLLNIFPWFRRFQPALPRVFQRHVAEVKNINHTVTPFLAGAATFFLPCGFTQAMQLYALSTGSFWTGSLTMLSFALGTLPVLALLSFSSLFVHRREHLGAFFKTAGLVVIFFGLSNVYQTLLVKVGGHPLSSVALVQTENGGSSVETAGSSAAAPTPPTTPAVASAAASAGSSQVIEILVKDGYTPEINQAKAGVPTLLRFKTQDTYDCSTAISIPQFGVHGVMPPTAVAEVKIPAQPSGTSVDGYCGMGMYHFQIQYH
jgi:sulfite exporter TauE/SafE/copper chaperone CopZ